MSRKGIILAGGRGTRLYPTTKSTPKALLPIYDKPMIYHPISTLMLAGIQEILVITTVEDQLRFKDVLGNGSQWGINIEFATQDAPRGIAEALIIAEDFIDNQPSVLHLGDNIFYGAGFGSVLKEASNSDKCTIFSYNVPDPERFGICEFDENFKVTSIVEKPKKPKSNFAVTGLYFYDKNAAQIAKSITPSDRGELEITDVNIAYMKKNALFTSNLGRGFAWIDAGTIESFFDAGVFVRTIERRQGIKIACLEEIALRQNWITPEIIIKHSDDMKSDYGLYVKKLLK